MSYWYWDARAGVGLSGTRRVLPAAHVPLLSDALLLAETLSTRLSAQADELDQLRREAHGQAHAAGLAQARADAEAELARRLLALDEAARENEARRNAEVARLALAVVHKLVGDWPEPVQLLAAASHAAASLAPARVLRVLVHPDALDSARDALRARLLPDATNKAHEHLRHAEWVAEPALPRQGCRIETEWGAVDVGLAEQLARVAAAWKVNAP